MKSSPFSLEGAEEYNVPFLIVMRSPTNPVVPRMLKLRGVVSPRLLMLPSLMSVVTLKRNFKNAANQVCREKKRLSLFMIRDVLRAFFFGTQKVST